MSRRYRRGARFVMDERQHSRPLDRNQRARILYLAEQLERRTKPARGRNGVLGYVGLAVLRSLMLGFLRRHDGLCCPSVQAIMEKTGLARSTIFEALNRLEASGILKRTARLVRRVVDFGGFEALTTVQATSLYAFFCPNPNAHLLPIKKRPSRTARLLSMLGRSLSVTPGSAGRSGIHLGKKERGFQGENVTGATA